MSVTIHDPLVTTVSLHMHTRGLKNDHEFSSSNEESSYAIKFVVNLWACSFFSKSGTVMPQDAQFFNPEKPILHVKPSPSSN